MTGDKNQNQLMINDFENEMCHIFVPHFCSPIVTRRLL